MQIKNLYPGSYAANCYLVTKGDTAVLVDCTASVETVTKALSDTSTHLAAILLTHGHFDHMLTLDAVKAATGAPIYLMAGDRDLPGDGQKNAFSVFFGADRSYPDADRLIEDGEVLTFGKLTLRALNTPGHTRGSAVYIAENVAFTGDTLFNAGFGRCDLYGSDATAIIHSLNTIATLSPNTVIYPGHGRSARLSHALDTIKGLI